MAGYVIRSEKETLKKFWSAIMMLLQVHLSATDGLIVMRQSRSLVMVFVLNDRNFFTGR